jgi:hypothetical protein
VVLTIGPTIEAISWRARAHSEKEREKEEWRLRMERHLTRWRGLLEKNEGIIASIETDINEYEEMQEYAQAMGHSNLDGKSLERKYKKISDIRETNIKVREKIQAVEEKIR